MTEEEKKQKSSFLFETLDSFLEEKTSLIISELKEDSKLDKDAIVNILLEVYNRSSTITKIIYPCHMCNNTQSDCFVCDLLEEEIQTYK